LARTALSPTDLARRDAKQVLVDRTRELMEAVALLDAASTDPAEIESVADDVEALERRLRGLPSHRDTGLNSAKDWASTLNQRSPISGYQNPVAAPLVLESDGVTTFGHATFGAVYEGPAGVVHGGIVASAFDELLGVAQAASGAAGMTGTLTIKMRGPTPLHTRIDYEAGVHRVEGRKIFAWGRSMANGQVVGEADGVFITARQ
jgi:acyl-coenzyme A thioesterase PaaI-like protein